MSLVKSKPAAANHGYLTARHWQDIRQAARLSRSEGVTLITHGVTTSPTDRGQENQPQPQKNSMTTPARGGRGQQPKGSIGHACEQPSAKKQQEQQPPKKQRDQERSLRRAYEFQQSIACGARWQPLVRKLLRRERAISRAAVWTAHCRRKIELRKKMGDFFSRALHALRHKPLVIRDTPQPANGAIAGRILRYLAMRLRMRRNTRAANAVMLPVYTRNLLSIYVKERHVDAAFAMIRLRDLRNLFMNYRVVRNQEAATASIIPFDENSPCNHTLSDSPPQKPSAKRAKKPKAPKGKGRR